MSRWWVLGASLSLCGCRRDPPSPPVEADAEPIVEARDERVVYFAELDLAAMPRVQDSLRRREAILFADDIVVSSCDIGETLSSKTFAKPYHRAGHVDPAHVPWLTASSGELTFEADVVAELTLDERFIGRGRGSTCADVTHVSQFVQVGSGRLLVDGTGYWGSVEPDAPLRAVVVPTTIEVMTQARIESAPRPSAPMIQIEGGVYAGKPIQSFWLDRFEVAASAFRACVRAGHCERPPKNVPSTYYATEKLDLPISGTNFFDAEAFCQWAGKRLPTIDEWQWAARGREERRLFAWGDAQPDCTRARGLDDVSSPGEPCGDGFEPSPRGSRPLGASRDGVEDLAGNVEEWVAEPGVWAGSGIESNFSDWQELGAFTSTAVGNSVRWFAGFRCAADTLPDSAAADSAPAIAAIPEMRLFVHDNPGQRTQQDAKKFCTDFAVGDRREWRLPARKMLAEIRMRLELPDMPRWSTAVDRRTKYARALCVHDEPSSTTGDAR